jgi:predicted permease
MARTEDRKYIVDDFREMYEDLSREYGPIRARRWYGSQVLKSVPMFILNLVFGDLVMLKNHLVIALRNIRKHKGYSFINIAGLAIGMACSILIFLWIRDELGYDRFHSRAAEIHRIYRDETATAAGAKSALTSPPMAAALKKDFPEVLQATRFGAWGSRLVSVGDKNFIETRYGHADPDFFEMFSFPFARGNARTAFSSPQSVVLTRKAADKYFGRDDPLGKRLTVDQTFDVVVTGVLADVPLNSSLEFDFLSPFDFLITKYLGVETGGNWGVNSFSTFVRLRPGLSAREFNAKLGGYLQRYQKDDTDILAVQSLPDIHLRSGLSHDYPNVGNIKYVWIFGALALFILAIASINFMNLTTARSANRAREVGLRKVVGAQRTQLIRQFFGESVLMSVFALAAALILVELCLRPFNGLSGKHLATDWPRNLPVFLGCCGLAFVTGLLSGSYPALLLSSFQPIRVLKGSFRSAGANARLRKILVVLQFSLSIFLIIGTIVISRQLAFMRSTDLGFNRDRVLYFGLVGELNSKYPLIRERLLRNPGVLNITASLSLPTNIQNSPGIPEWEGKEPGNKMEIKADFVDYDYIETFGVPIVEGRSFSRTHATDAEEAYIVNEEALRRMGLRKPAVGKRFAFWDIQGQIIGVMKDAHFQALHHKIEPLVFKIKPEMFRFLYVKVRAGDISAILRSLEKDWAALSLGYPFQYRFLDESFDNLYRTEARMGTLTRTFAALAILIACLGLFGLASFMAEQRVREIGVRKVLGATERNIFVLLSKEFAVLILAANFFAWPVAYLMMKTWLSGFAYRVGMQLGFFLAAAGLALATAMLTVGILTRRAARANPAAALRWN